MELRLEPALGHSLAATADLLNRGFAGYVVPISLDETAFRHWIQIDGVDMDSSRVIAVAGEPVGVALIARREQTSRLAGMAIVPEARGRGVGQAAMKVLMDQAQARGERTMELEVIEGNDPAIKLYRSCGFHTLRRLVSYVLAGGTEPDAPALEVIDLADMARLVQAHGLSDLPWQISGQTLARLGPPNAAYRRTGAYVAISNPEAGAIYIRSVLVEPQARRQGQATGLLQALVACYRDRTWLVAPLCPEEMGGLFEKAGFAPDTLTQLQMLVHL